MSDNKDWEAFREKLLNAQAVSKTVRYAPPADYGSRLLA